ncbi:hypothetical protein EXM65_01675 [Clostridium botulinum]|uniref:NrS-1 polymerase-like HBD domain-containing protein n=1 Tax=Clostridium botulinum TaxID=1491 RepID=A0A6M0SNG9_CLOBO|nr:hypothetical protein [Clostridium botulinum]
MIQENNIPIELRELKQWVLWKLEDKNGKPTKIPYTISNKKADTTNSDTWESFDNVVQAYKSGGYSGIGFVFSKDDDYVGIDFDHCINDKGILAAEVAKIVNKAKSYTEVSHSGKGIHIIICGGLDKAFKRKEIELYSHSRYFTFTGNRICTVKNITENQKLIDELLLQYAPKKNNEKKKEEIQTGAELQDAEIKKLLEKAFCSKQDFKIEALYEGNWQDLYSSQSEADQALCNYLAFWLNKNPSNIDKAFRESGLYREKWEREDYRATTIEKSIYSCEESYQEYIEKVQAQHMNIWAENNCYKKKAKNGYTVISNFIIKPIRFIECIDNADMSVLECQLITDDNHVIIKQYKASDFDNTQNFDKATNDFRTKFTGNVSDLKNIKVMAFNEVEHEIQAFSYGGVQYLNNEWYYLDDKGGFNSKGQKIDNIILYNESSIIKSSLSQIQAINKEEIKELSKYLFNFNSPEIAINIMGYVGAIFMKEKLKRLNIKFSHMFNSGESGAGKSETLENIIVPILNIDNGIMSADGCTKFVLEKLMNSNNTLPVIIEEYKPGFVDNYKLRLISGIMRNSYDGHESLRGNEKLNIDSNKLRSSIILCGESSSDETAVIERSLLLTFSKRDSGVEERTKAYEYLKRNTELLNKLGRGLAETSLILSVDDINNMYAKCKNHIDNNIKVDRVRNTGVITSMGIILLQCLYERLGLSFEKETKLSNDDIFNYINHNLIDENLNGNSYTKSIIDITLEHINDMFRKINCDYDTKYARVMQDDVTGKNILAIQLKSVYTEFYKYIKEYNLPNKFLEWRDFQKQLQKADYYIIHNKTVKFSLGVGQGKIDKKCFKLDLDILQAKEIEIDNIRQYAETE